MKTALYIGRFQPFHNGHLDAIFQLKEKGFKRIIIGIGSSNEERTLKNPFSFKERFDMIDLCLKNKMIEVDYDIVGIPDFGDNKKWVDYILRELPDFEVVASGNSYVYSCFKDIQKEIFDLELRFDVKGTNVRDDILFGKQFCDVEIPNEVADYICKNKLDFVLRKLDLKKMPKTPLLAVDVVVRYGDGIVLVKRKNKPFGYALPGGFCDVGESVEVSALRELKEETCLDVENLELLGVYSRADRDPRFHVTSVVYSGDGFGDLIAGDDAREVRIVRDEDLIDYDLVFDHEEIIKDYLQVRGKKNEENIVSRD